MKKEKQKKETKAIAILQIFILVIATIAFSWIVGSSIKTVSANPGDDEKKTPPTNSQTDNRPLCGSGGKSFQSCTTLSDCKTIDYTQKCLNYGEYCCAVKKYSIDEGKKDSLFSKAEDIALNIGEGYATQKAYSFLDNKVFGKKAGEKVVQKAVEEGVSSGTKPIWEFADPGIKPGPHSTPVKPGSISSWLTGKGGGGGYFGGGGGMVDLFQNLVSGAIWATAAVIFVNYFAKWVGMSDRNSKDIVNAAIAGGTLGVITVVVIGASSSGPIGWIAGAIALAIAALWTGIAYKKYAQEAYTYRIALWQPPTGGAECSKCNLLKVGTGKNQVSGCSEYICHSYGASCEWVNDKTEYETCIEVNKGDISPPVITPAKEIYGEPVFKDNKFKYVSSAAGTRIVYEGEGGGAAGCVPAFTQIKLALITNEEAHCKISLKSSDETAANAFGAMQDMAEGNVYTKNHTLQIPSSILADKESFENAGYILNNGGKYNFYVRCKDQRGNINTQDYEIRFCVQKGLNTNPPKIVGTNPAKDSFIPFNVSVIENFQVYTDRPADCKWDIKEASYNYMSYDFDKCSQNVDDYLIGFDYGCQTNLTGFKDGVENKYYVACKNYPEFKGNPEKESKRTPSRPYEIVLKGTNKLVIQSVRINDRANGTTIIGREENAKIELSVVTIGGAEEGKSRCLYSENQVTPTYSLFSNGRSREYLNTNFEEFYMPQGFYEYLIKCYDSAENTATTLINFTVEVDLLPPIVVRAFKDDSSNSLKIITDENAKCVYSTTSCNYNVEEGNELSTENGKEHYIEWNPEIDLYVKCIDDYHNYPNEGECSIVVRPFEMMGVF